MLITWVLRQFKRKNASDTPAQSQPCPHNIDMRKDTCIDCRDEKSRARKYRWKIILGLVFPYALQALDATIIASALPWIAEDFDEVSQLNWIVSAFNLTAAAFIPCWAQMADVFGRNTTINMAIILMLIGSAMCTGAPTDAFALLLFGRALQGIAAAGLNVVVRAILADRVSLKENAKNWAIFAFVGGISYALGPVIGGYLTTANWRWCFGINLPVGAVALAVTFFILRKELLGPQPIPELNETSETGRRTKFAARIKTIDAGGQVLFIVGFGLIILALTWGGASYPWDSAAVLVPLIVGCVITGVFAYWERLLAPGNVLSRKMPWQRPMIPWSILTNRDIGLLFYAECTSGMGMFAVLYFCNIYFISVKEYSSDEAGVQLLFFTPGLGAGVIICSLLSNSWPRMTWPPIFLGTLLEPIGVGLIAYGMYIEHSPTIFGSMVLVGAGTGMRFMAAPLHGVGIFRKHRAAVIGLMATAVPLGGTVGLTIMSTVFNNISGLSGGDVDFAHLREVPPKLLEKSIHQVKMGVVWAFVAITPLLVLAFFCSLFLGNIKLGQGEGTDDEGSQNIVIEDIYLLTLISSRSNTADGEKGLRQNNSDEYKSGQEAA